MNIVTGDIKLKPSEHSQLIAKKLLNRFWWIFFIPPVAFSLAALTFEMKFLYLIPIFVFLVYPMVVLWGYSIASLSREAVESVVNHRFEISDDGIKYIPVYEETVPFDDRTMKEYFIGVDEVDGVEHETNRIVVCLHGNIGRVIILPIDKLPVNTNVEGMLLKEDFPENKV